MSTFSTQNETLANLLATVGCEFASPAIVNMYTPDDLSRAGVTKVSDAPKRGIKGRVTYTFTDSDLLRDTVRTFDAVRADMASGGAPDVDPHVLAVAAAALAHNRAELKAAWRSVTPYLIFDMQSKSESTPDGSGRVTGSYKVISAKASPELRRRLLQ